MASRAGETGRGQVVARVRGCSAGGGSSASPDAGLGRGGAQFGGQGGTSSGASGGDISAAGGDVGGTGGLVGSGGSTGGSAGAGPCLAPNVLIVIDRSTSVFTGM